MKTEYLLFNLIVLSGPLSLSFDRKVHYVDKWPRVFLAIVLPMAMFIFWDALVTGRHWWFNDAYTLDIRFFNLPIEEWLFFLTVGFSSLFIWEVLAAYFDDPEVPRGKFIQLTLPVLIPIGLWLFRIGREYSGLVLMALGAVAIFDRWLLNTHIFLRRRTYHFLAIITGVMLIFNGYLTARPVVLYNELYHSGIRIYTIPIEDFGYGYIYLLLSIMLYEKIKGGRNG